MKQDPIEALSLLPCNQNVYSKKNLFFFGLNFFLVYIFDQNFVLCHVEILLLALFLLCTGVTLFLRLVFLQDWKKKKKKKVNWSTKYKTWVCRTRVLTEIKFNDLEFYFVLFFFFFHKAHQSLLWYTYQYSLK